MGLLHSGLGRDKLISILSGRRVRVYFIGIGGVSMRSLAALLAARGAIVSGSDREAANIQGISTHIGHRAENIIAFSPDLAVYTLAIDKENPEYKAALARGIPTVSRAELLGAVMSGYKTRIGISGAHGKSTVTSQLGEILIKSSKNPTILSGVRAYFGESALIGGDEVFLYEACEYQRSFLKSRPTVAVITNIELDHVDTYSDTEDIKRAYTDFANLSALAVVDIDDRNIRDIYNRIKTKKITLSGNAGADYRYTLSLGENGRYGLSLYRADKPILNIKELSVIGKYNAKNAAFAAAVADSLGCPRERIAEGLIAFSGIPRRMERIGRVSDCDIYYDYAHHPTEISAAISSLKDAGYERILAVFAPHTYSRTAAFFSDFKRALSLACKVIVTDIYAAREKPVKGVSAKSLAAAAGGEYLPLSRLYESLLGKTEDYDCLVMLGAGDFGECVKYFRNNA